ncbi:MAG: hypothetical protein ACR2II_09750 [Chthoniobacterales bacterium]
MGLRPGGIRKGSGNIHWIMQNRILRGAIGLGLLLAAVVSAERPRISEDRELKEIDLTGWDCRDRLEGTAKTFDAIERNRLKNHPPAALAGALPESLDPAAFLRYIDALDSQTQGKRRKDINAAQKAELDKYEKRLVSLTGYLAFAYAGPPESTNCASGDFHDWHLELFAEPSDHPPRPGDPTPIICEITPRTQNGVFRDGIRLQSLAAFIRAPDLSYEPTGHPARKIRVIGTLLWDDEHNGSADVGPTVQTAGPNKYHNPWGSTAWEIHPVTKIESLGNGSLAAAGYHGTPKTTAIPTAPTPKFITLTRPITIKIPNGETVLPRGLKLPITARSGQGITIQYLGKALTIPADAAIPSR